MNPNYTLQEIANTAKQQIQTGALQGQAPRPMTHAEQLQMANDNISHLSARLSEMEQAITLLRERTGI